MLSSSEFTSPGGAPVSDKSEVELSRACDARLLCQSLTQSLGSGSRSVSLFVPTDDCYICSLFRTKCSQDRNTVYKAQKIDTQTKEKKS